MDRYYDYMDLSLLTCIIQYITPDDKMHWYAVPFRDVTTEKDNDKMIIPWSVDGNVTQYAGVVAFSIRFYSVEQEIIARSDEIDDEVAKDIEPEIKYNLLYNLTTLPAYSKILEGMEVKEAANDFNISGEAAAYLLQLIQQINREEGVDWILADPS